VSHWASHL